MDSDILTAYDQPTERVRCPIHGFIRFSLNERQLINHWTFQRLRNIRQLALTYMVYPGAMHTRFEHSLGVMELATRAFDILTMKHRELLKLAFQEIPELRGKDCIAKARQVVRLHALLHDVGHTPFSHAGEFLIAEGHEVVSSFVIDKKLGKQIDKLFFSGARGLLGRILAKKPDTLFLAQFVVGEMDMDRTDYLRRDSVHCGVEYGRFDALRLLESLTVIKNEDTGRLEMAIERGGEHTFEALILARYQMNTQVYFHKTRRIYDHYLEEYLRAWGVENCSTPEKVLKHDDTSLLAQMKLDSKKKRPSSKWAQRILNRQHHRVVDSTGDSADTKDLQLSKRVFTELKNDFQNVDFFIDINAHGNIHKLTVPDDQEDKITDLFVVNKRGDGKVSITDDSAIMRKIPKKFRVVRIYADASDKKLRAIREKAIKIRNSLR